MVFLQWLLVLVLAALAGRLVSRLKLPAILGWLLAGMLLGPHGLDLLPQTVLDAGWYRTIIMWMQCAFGLMLGTELVWRKLRKSGQGLVITTLTQSLGTFLLVSLVFGLAFWLEGIPLYLALVFGSIALATAPAPALSIVNEFHARGPVTDTLLPMAVLDDVVGIVVFFSVNALVAGIVSGGSGSLAMIPAMILLPVAIGLVTGLAAGWLLRKCQGSAQILTVLLAGITLTVLLGWLIGSLLPGITLNYMLMGVSYSAVFTNMVSEKQLEEVTACFQPVLMVSLLAAIVDLGAPLDFRLILGAGFYTFLYIASRAAGKYFGARFGATITHLPRTVQKYLGLTLLPHSGVSLVFTGIAASTLAGKPELAAILQGTIAAAAVINEIIAVLAARKGFQLAGEIKPAAD